MYGGGGGDPPPIQPAANSGEFLLSLLQRPNQRQQQQQQSQLRTHFSQLQYQAQLQQQQQQQQQQQLQSVSLDPAVAAVGPSVGFSHQVPSWQSNGRDLQSSPPWPHTLSPTLPPGFPGLPHNQFQGNHFPLDQQQQSQHHQQQQSQHQQQQSQQRQQQRVLADDLLRLGFSSNSNTIHNLVQHKQQLEQKLQFGSLPADLKPVKGFSVKEPEGRSLNGLESNLRQFDPQADSNSRTFDGKRMPPPGFSSQPRGGGGGGVVGGGGGNWDYANRRRELEQNLNVEKGTHDQLHKRDSFLSGGNERERLRGSNGSQGSGLTRQLDRPGLSAGSSNLHLVSASDVEESMMQLSVAEIVDNGEEDDHGLDDITEANGKRDKKNKKELRSDNRGQKTLSQRQRMHKRHIVCRRDINRLDAYFLRIYESLIPPEEEKAKQKQLLASLEKLVKEEWPEARLYLYGSCANSFGVSKSDIDVCLAMEDATINKSEVLLKLAKILESDNLQNVQALTRARVPIVKLMDPVTAISCDICVNNVLAVVNTKLLRDYAYIDVRLRQLAFIVKHWAKSRGVNETYQGTLSSYAYVLMCINFLQLRHPAILPCLQKMEPTYSVTVDDIHCAYYDRVEALRSFGSPNDETISELVWAFFNYWAYHHDYSNDVISVRTGSLISKREKDWTRRVGNDRHLICIEDPFEISHDLGRVVDKNSIKVLREEFERAAYIMQYDPNPCVTLFEPYVPI